MNFRHNIAPYAAVALAAAEFVVVLVSWLVGPLVPALPVRSVLSGEGARWFVGSFTDNVSSPLLVWLLLCQVAYGALTHGGLWRAVSRVVRHRQLDYRERHAFYAVVLLLAMTVAAVILLAFVPHAILLGVSGGLFPSPFSAGIMPVAAFSVTVLSVAYGVFSGVLVSVSDVFRCLYAGVVDSAPLIPLYILASQLYHTLVFVFF